VQVIKKTHRQTNIELTYEHTSTFSPAQSGSSGLTKNVLSLVLIKNSNIQYNKYYIGSLDRVVFEDPYGRLLFIPVTSRVKKLY